MKRVLFVASFPPPYTGEAICTQLNFALASQRASVDAVNISHGATAPRKTGSFAWHRIAGILGSYSEVSQKLANKGCDILYFVPGATPLGQIKDWYLLSKLPRARVGTVVAHIHNGNFDRVLGRPLLGAISQRLFKRIDRFILLNQEASNSLAHFLPLAKHHVVRNTIEQAMLFTDAEVEDRIAARKNRTCWQIYYISNMIREKGYPELAEAASFLRKDSSLDFHLHFIGGWPPGSSASGFEASLRELGLQDRTTIHGPIQDREKLRAHLKQADLVALPTFYSREAQPMCLLEAANAGIPLVGTRHAGIPEIIKDQENGRLVEKHDSVGLAQAIRDICQEKQWETFAKNSRVLFLRHYSPATNAGAFVNALFGNDEN